MEISLEIATCAFIRPHILKQRHLTLYVLIGVDINRGLQVRLAVDQAPLTAEQALELNLIDEPKYRCAFTTFTWPLILLLV